MAETDLVTSPSPGGDSPAVPLPMLPGGEQPRKRGRPPGSKSKSTSTPKPLAEEGKQAAVWLAEQMKTGFDYLAATRGPHWNRPSESCLAVAQPAVKVFGRAISPEFLEKWGDWIALGFATVALMGPPLYVEWQLAKKEDMQDANPSHSPHLQGETSPSPGAVPASDPKPGSAPTAPPSLKFQLPGTVN